MLRVNQKARGARKQAFLLFNQYHRVSRHGILLPLGGGSTHTEGETQSITPSGTELGCLFASRAKVGGTAHESTNKHELMTAKGQSEQSRIGSQRKWAGADPGLKHNGSL